MQKMPKGLRNFIKAIVFLAVLIAVFIPVRNVLVLKTAEQKCHSFYSEKNNFDVLFLGISHMKYGISPMELWNNYGITSFNWAQSDSHLGMSYWILKNALNYTKPKLVVVDARCIEQETTAIRHGLGSINFDEMPFSLTKIQAVADLLKNGETFQVKLEDLFPFLHYHSRWPKIEESDFEPEQDYWPDKGTLHYKKGIYLDGNDTLKNTGEKAPGSKLMTDYLVRIVDLCRKNGIEVMLMEQPFMTGSTAIAYANGVEDLAAELGVEYLNFFSDDYINTINYGIDLFDAGHLNVSGLYKVNEATARYIKDHYDLPDRRTDPAYSTWYDDYEVYRADMLQHLKNSKYYSIYDYLLFLTDSDVNVELDIPAGSPIYADETVMALIRNLVFYEADLESFDAAAAAGDAYSLDIDRIRKTHKESVGTQSDRMLQWETTPDLSLVAYDNRTGERYDRVGFKYEESGEYNRVSRKKEAA